MPLWSIQSICVAAGVVAAVSGCQTMPPIEDCVAKAGMTPDCRFHDPEDIVVSPSGKRLIVAQLGDERNGGRAGSLVAYTPPEGELLVLPPNAEGGFESEMQWGDASCPPPDASKFSPHGIDIEIREDGKAELFVVNHGGRESIEFFEILEDEATLRIVWRGCVEAPEEYHANDVVGFADGSFWASHMMGRSDNQNLGLLRMMLTSYAPGKAWSWSKAAGTEDIPDSAVQFGNGVEKSDDGRYLFLCNYMANEVVKIDVANGKRVGSVAAASPDNLAWAPDGRLLVTGHQGAMLDTLACFDIEDGNCGIRFHVTAIDTEAMTATQIFTHEGPPMGAATVARVMGDSIYLGTFAGDRVSRISRSVLDRVN